MGERKGKRSEIHSKHEEVNTLVEIVKGLLEQGECFDNPKGLKINEK